MVNSKKSTRRKIILLLFSLCLILITCFFILKCVYIVQHISLQSTWRSEETGQVLTFTNQNSVQFEGNLPNGIYHILSPNTMEYTIDGKTFIMLYRIEGQKLYWGTSEDRLECFQKIWY